MSTGLDPGGTDRFLCANLGSGSNADSLVPNVFLGGFDTLQSATPSPAMPSVALGTSDFSIECWLALTAGAQYHADLYTWDLGYIDFVSGATDYYANFKWSPLSTVDSALFDPDGDGGTAAVTPASYTLGTYPTWSHHVLNVDRSANAEYLLDGTSLGTGDISGSAATDIGTREFHFMAMDTGVISDLDGADSCPYMLGPIASHNRLLTAAEIQDSVGGRTVNNFGSSVTHFVYNWKRIRGATGWDLNPQHIHNTYRFGSGSDTAVGGGLPYPIMAPMGTVGSVLAEDASGNDNHHILKTSASYADASGSRSNIAFSMTNFFR